MVAVIFAGISRTAIAPRMHELATDIRPKFTTQDVDHMTDFGIDLADYTSVSDNADHPDSFTGYRQSHATGQQWIDGGSNRSRSFYEEL
jgi:hypothetical protein